MYNNTSLQRGTDPLEGLWFGIYISIAILGCSKGVNDLALHGTQSEIGLFPADEGSLYE